MSETDTPLIVGFKTFLNVHHIFSPFRFSSFSRCVRRHCAEGRLTPAEAEKVRAEYRRRRRAEQSRRDGQNVAATRTGDKETSAAGELEVGADAGGSGRRKLAERDGTRGGWFPRWLVGGGGGGGKE